jgi:hypothetical protein
MTHRTTTHALFLAGLLAFGSRAAFAEDPPAPEPEKPAPDAPAPDAPAPDAPAPAPEAAPPAPETPPPTGGPRRWMLSISHGPLKVVRDAGQTYHYVLLTVGNDTAVARPWQPFIQAETDTGRVHVACGCSGAVEQVRRRERDPSLLSVEGSVGKIAPGEKKKIAAVFGPIDSSWSRVSVLVQGLVNPVVTHRVQKYGEKVIVSDAAYEERNEKVMEEVRKAAKESGGEVPAPTMEYREFMERRAYAITWQRKGDEFRPEEDPIEFVSEGWRVLGDPVILRTWTPQYTGGGGGGS